MSAKIAAVNQARSESESLERTVSLIAVDPEPVPPPPSYEQAITTLLHIERNRVLSKQRILEELAEGNRNVEQTPTEEPSTSQRPSDQQVAELPSSTPSMPSTVPPNYQIIQHVNSAPPLVGPNSSNLTCPSCQKAIKTRIDYKVSTITHIGALVCCVICWPCAFCPYIIKDCRDAYHYCPSCDALIGVHTAFRG